MCQIWFNKSHNLCQVEFPKHQLKWSKRHFQERNYDIYYYSTIAHDPTLEVLIGNKNDMYGTWTVSRIQRLVLNKKSILLHSLTRLVAYLHLLSTTNTMEYVDLDSRVQFYLAWLTIFSLKKTEFSYQNISMIQFFGPVIIQIILYCNTIWRYKADTHILSTFKCKMRRYMNESYNVFEY